MDYKLAGTAAIRKSEVVTYWNGLFLISIAALVTTTDTPALKLTADVDAVHGVEL